MKPVAGSYRAATQVNVVSLEIVVVEEADSISRLEGSMHQSVMARPVALLRGHRQWHGNERNMSEPGRTFVLLV